MWILQATLSPTCTYKSKLMVVKEFMKTKAVLIIAPFKIVLVLNGSTNMD
jgi:hypothetical protein